MVRAGSNLLAESRHRRPVGEEDRSGPGNNKSIYESETGREGDGETGSAALFFSTVAQPDDHNVAIVTRTVQRRLAAGERSERFRMTLIYIFSFLVGEERNSD